MKRSKLHKRLGQTWRLIIIVTLKFGVDSLRKKLPVLHFITWDVLCLFQNVSYGCENFVFHSKGRTQI
jgi:hypothetical protein